MAFLGGFLLDYFIKNKCMISTFLVMDLWAGPRADFSQYYKEVTFNGGTCTFDKHFQKKRMNCYNSVQHKPFK